MEKIFADLHIHSKYSRACSKDLDFKNLAKWAKVKGIDLLGTGDFTHPIWFEEIKKLKPNGKGLYYFEDFPFMITGEISLIYTEKGKGRRIHLNLLVSSIEIAEKIHAYIDGKGLRRDYDGRPIFKISCEEFTREMMNISKAIEVIPAHVWTPWFGVFGSKGGYDSLEEAFGEQVENIHAIETGISSDPPMNWRIDYLKNKSIVSFSDLHSFWPWRLGREATIFHKSDSYFEVVEQIRKNTFIGTVETDPAYGKYHWDGHSSCKYVQSAEETKEKGKICPKCNRELIVGVEYRVEEIAEQKVGFKPDNGKMFYTLMPLHEIISFIVGTGVNTKRVWDVYWKLVKPFKNEFDVLLNVSKEDLLKACGNEKVVEWILRNRKGEIKVKPGYDGLYGEIEEVKKTASQMLVDLVTSHNGEIEK